MGRKGSAQGGHSAGGKPAFGGSGPYRLEGLLGPRVEDYVKAHGDTDADELVEYLRSTFREYQRKQVNALRKSVERVLASLEQRRSGGGRAPASGGDELDALEARHLSARGGSDGDEFETDTDSDEESSEESSGPDSSGGLAERTFSGLGAGSSDSEETKEEERAARAEARGVLNASLRASYAVKPAKRRGGSEERPAFAAPELVAAAAARALAAERAAKAAAEEPAAVAGNGAPAAAGPADVAVPLPRKRAAAANGGGAVGADEPAGAAPAARAPKRARAAGMVGGGGGFAAGAAMMGAAGGATPTKPRDLRLSDLGGIDASLGAIRENILCPLAHPELYSWLGVEAPRGVLLSGPPGCGKTSLAHAIATEAGVPFFAIAAPEIVSGMSGESEAKLRSLFASAAAAAPSVIFIDEIDAIAPKRESAQREMERRIVAQLLVCLDDLSSSHAGHVAVLGATNRVDALDSALRRAGRFDREITLGVPDEAARARILEVQARKVRLEGAFDFKRIARLTPGYVGADLAALTKEAAALAVARIFSVLAAPAGAPPVADAVLDPAALASSRDALFERGALSAEEMSGLAITMSDYEEALPRVQPSAQREGFATVPDVTWDDVGSLADVREELAFAITLPIAHPTRFAALGLGGGMGVLLYGPPGCGKTLLAKATANDARANFISIKGPELLNKYVGESERAVRTVFARARAASPCVLFFDELDSLAPRRGAAGDGSAAAERVVNQLLTEMDGLDPRKGVYVVAATNRPDMIDPAMLRPGRLDKLLFVPLPPADGRASILRALTRKTPLAPGVDLAAVAQRCDGFSGADLSSLVREASWAALRAIYRTEGVASTADAAGQPEPGLETIHADALRVTVAHFDDALQRVTPSVTEEDRRRYDRLRNKLQRCRGHIVEAADEPAAAAPQANV